MSVYMIVEIEVVDRETYAEYMEKVPATVEKYGGRYIVRGGVVTPLTGGWALGILLRILEMLIDTLMF